MARARIDDVHRRRRRVPRRQNALQVMFAQILDAAEGRQERDAETRRGYAVHDIHVARHEMRWQGEADFLAATFEAELGSVAPRAEEQKVVLLEIGRRARTAALFEIGLRRDQEPRRFSETARDERRVA